MAGAAGPRADLETPLNDPCGAVCGAGLDGWVLPPSRSCPACGSGLTEGDEAPPFRCGDCGARLVWPDFMAHAGSVSDEEATNADTGRYDRRKLKLTCPACGRLGAPLCWAKTIPAGDRIHPLDGDSSFRVYQTVCRCGQPWEFVVVTPGE